MLFHSPYEAAAWSVISHRRGRAQAAPLRTRLAAEHGRTFELAGEHVAAFPLPDTLAMKIAERWAPFRTWAVVLIRVAGDQAGLPFEQYGRMGA